MTTPTGDEVKSVLQLINEAKHAKETGKRVIRAWLNEIMNRICDVQTEESKNVLAYIQRTIAASMADPKPPNVFTIAKYTNKTGKPLSESLISDVLPLTFDAIERQGLHDLNSDIVKDKESPFYKCELHFTMYCQTFDLKLWCRNW